MPRHLNLRLRFTQGRRNALIVPVLLLGISFAQTAEPAGDKKVAEPLRFLSSFSADQDVNGDRTNCQRLRDVIHPSAAAIGMAPERPAVCDQVVDIIAGDKDAAARIPKPILAAKVATDSKLRVLITEPSTRTVHILDFAHRKYLRIDGARGDRMNTPYGIAVDADNNIYITDLDRGRIVVYNASGKFMKYIGDVKGEGSFQNPRAIAIDRVSGRIYLADTSRNFVLILDRDGNVIAQFGKRGGGNGPAEFRQPTDLAIYGDELYILDRHNLRIQILDLDGNFRRQFNLRGIGDGDANGMAFDSQGRLFVLGMTWVQAFSRDGKPLFRFGHNGDQPGEFERPSDICTDAKDHVYVVDSGNRRIQVFQAR